MRNEKLKKFNTVRVKTSLATCSLVLVLFSAVLYTASVPGIFQSNNIPGRLLSGILSGDIGLGSESSSADGNTEGMAFAGTADGLTSPAGSLSSSPTFSQGSLSSVVTSMVQAAENESAPSKGEESSNGSIIEAIVPEPIDPNLPSTENKDETEEVASTGMSEEEKGYHDLLVKYYSEAKSYYEQICSGYRNVYAQIESSSSPSTKISAAPFELSVYIKEVESKRVTVLNCSYDGARIGRSSMWYSEYLKVYRLYENLVNAAVILKEIEGKNRGYAIDRLSYYSDENGKIPPLVKFKQYYADVHL